MRASLRLLPALLSCVLGCTGQLLADPEPGPADTTPPEVTILEPAEGAFVEGEQLVVRGRVQDDGGAVTVRVDGEPVAVGADGGFELSRPVAPGAHRVRVEASDAAGNTTSRHAAAIVGHFEAPGTATVSAAALTVGRGALAEAGRAAGALLSELDLDPELTRSNPVASGFWGRADILGETHGPATVTITPRDGALDVRVSIRSVRVDALLDPSFGGNVAANLTSTQAVASGAATVRMVGGEPVVGLSGLSVRLEGFAFDVDRVPSFLEDLSVVRDAVRRRVEAEVEAAAIDAVTPLLEDVVSRVPTSRRITILGTRIDLSAEGFDVTVDEGGVWAAADLAMRAVDPVPERAERGVLTGLSDPQRPPVHASDLAIDVALDTINAAAFTAWRSGLFEAQQDEIAAATPALTVGQLAILLPHATDHAPSTAPVALELRYPLPPVVSERDGEAVVTLPDVRVTVLAVVAGARVPLGSFSLGVSAPVSVTPTATGLSIGAGALSIVADRLDETGGGPSGGPSGARLDRLVEGLLAPLSAELAELGTIPAPRAYGFALTADAVTLEAGYLGVEGRATYR